MDTLFCYEGESQAVLPKNDKRLAYKCPQLVEYGTLMEITQGNTGSGDEVPGSTQYGT